MVKGVANVWVPVQDIERALDSYQNTLGFQPIKRDGPWAEIDASGLNIGLNGREPEEAQAGGGRVITFRPRGRARRGGRGPQWQRRGLSSRNLRTRMGQGGDLQGYGGQRPPALRAAALARNGTEGATPGRASWYDGETRHAEDMAVISGHTAIHSTLFGTANIVARLARSHSRGEKR
jgi:catechol 2,3-dioxygenase-like lactoylglutathione lyase family enzyme